jgi:hypothetical protein
LSRIFNGYSIHYIPFSSPTISSLSSWFGECWRNEYFVKCREELFEFFCSHTSNSSKYTIIFESTRKFHRAEHKKIL